MIAADVLTEDHSAMPARVSCEGQFLEVSPKLGQLLGMPEKDLTRCRFHDITHPDDLARDVAQMERLLSAGQGRYSLLKRYMHRSGVPIWIELEVALHADEPTRERAFDVVIRQVPVSPRTLEEVHDKAFRDCLTGLANRHALDEQLEAAMARTKRTGRPFVLAMLDLDGFKTINDTCGHRIGDSLLAAVSDRLRRGIGQWDFAARMGGDEFGLLLFDIEDEIDLRARIARIRQELMPVYDMPGGPIRMTASLGWALFPQEAQSLGALMEAADASMYRSKRAMMSRAFRRPPLNYRRHTPG